jgi:hypothetical protein
MLQICLLAIRLGSVIDVQGPSQVLGSGPIAGFMRRIPTVPRVTRVERRFTEKNWSAAVLKNSVSRLPTGTLHVRRSCTSVKRANGERRSEAEPHYFFFELMLIKAAMQHKDSSNL